VSKSSQRQFLVSVGDISGFFMTKTGGGITADVTKAYDGGDPDPDLIAAPRDVENVTVSRVFDPIRDGELLVNLRQLVGVLTTTVTVTATDNNYVVIGEPTVYSPALLVGLTEPEVDASSGDAATYELEFAVSSVR
jgi:hypothetical protein